jgi:hypothetical protein
MNKDNYAAQPIAQRLVDAGIVLKTDAVWYCKDTDWQLTSVNCLTHIPPIIYKVLPAPSFAEIWKELLRLADGNEINIVYWIQEIDDWDAMGADVALLVVETCSNIIKLTELLIWVKVTIKNLL